MIIEDTTNKKNKDKDKKKDKKKSKHYHDDFAKDPVPIEEEVVEEEEVIIEEVTFETVEIAPIERREIVINIIDAADLDAETDFVIHSTLYADGNI